MLDEGGLDPEMKEFLVEEKSAARAKLEELEQEHPPGRAREGPSRRQERHRRGAGRRRRRRGRPVRGRGPADDHALRRAACASRPTSSPPPRPTLGGIKEIIFEVKGRGAYGALKYESGVHRVQRVPVTESTGRIHTSTATVAVLPEVEDVEVAHRPQRGAGGRLPLHRTRAGSRSTPPTRRCGSPTSPRGWWCPARTRSRSCRTRSGPSASCAPASTTWPRPSRTPSVAAQRRSQVGTGDRAQKVRTYNFPQGRVTDHRVGLTSHRLEAILQGELDEFTEALQAQRPGGAAGRGRRSDRPGAAGRPVDIVDHRHAAGDGGRLPAARRAPPRPGSTPSCCWPRPWAWSASTSTRSTTVRCRPLKSTRTERSVARRAAHEPVAYILGRAYFRHLCLEVDPAVLIPRPETEELVDAGARRLLQRRPPWRAVAGARGRRPARPAALVADVGTGSGAIALSLAQEAGVRVLATDISAGGPGGGGRATRRPLGLDASGGVPAGRPAGRRARRQPATWWSATRRT